MLRPALRLLSLAVISLLLCAQAYARSVTLAWDANNPEEGVEGYKIYYGQQVGIYTNVIDAGNATTVTINNLLDGQAYRFVAAAYRHVEGEYQESRFSGEVVWDENSVALNSASDVVGEESCAEEPPPINTPPVATIQKPLHGQIFQAGDMVTSQGRGQDAEDGEIPASAFRWDIKINEGNYFFLGEGYTGGSRQVTYPGDYVLRLTVTDSEGLEGQATRFFVVE